MISLGGTVNAQIQKREFFSRESSRVVYLVLDLIKVSI